MGGGRPCTRVFARDVGSRPPATSSAAVVSSPASSSASSWCPWGWGALCRNGCMEGLVARCQALRRQPQSDWSVRRRKAAGRQAGSHQQAGLGRRAGGQAGLPLTCPCRHKSSRCLAWPWGFLSSAAPPRPPAEAPGQSVVGGGGGWGVCVWGGGTPWECRSMGNGGSNTAARQPSTVEIRRGRPGARGGASAGACKRVPAVQPEHSRQRERRPLARPPTLKPPP